MDELIAGLIAPNGTGMTLPKHLDHHPIDPPPVTVEYNLSTQPPNSSVGIGIEDRIIVPVLWSLIIIAGLVGNGLVVYVMLRFGEKQTTNCYIVNLAFTDLAFVLIVIPFTMLHYVIPYWIYGRFMCKFTLYMTYVLLEATCLTLTAMTVDRYFAIVHPIQSINKRTPRMAIIVSVSIWVVSVLSCIPFAIYHDIKHPDDDPSKLYCRENWPSEDISKAVFVIVVITTYVIPLAIIIVCYTFIIRNLVRHSLVTSNNNPPPGATGCSTSQTNQMRKRRKAIKLVAVVVALFALLWMPIHIFYLWQKFDQHFPWGDATYAYKIIGHTLSYANSCVNPFVYSFLSDGFRKAVKKAFPMATQARHNTALSHASAPPANSYVMCPTDGAPTRAAITKDTNTKMTSADTSPDVSPSQRGEPKQEQEVEFSTKYVKDGNGEEERVLICRKPAHNGKCDINEHDDENDPSD